MSPELDAAAGAGAGGGGGGGAYCCCCWYCCCWYCSCSYACWSCAAQRPAWRRETRFETAVAVPATTAVRAIPPIRPMSVPLVLHWGASWSDWFGLPGGRGLGLLGRL